MEENKLQEKAKEVWRREHANGYTFTSKLKDSDFQEVEKVETIFKFFKQTYTDYEMTEQFAKQFINYTKVREFAKLTKQFVQTESRTERGILMFTYTVKPDYAAIQTASDIASACNSVLKVYSEKRDTPAFDQKVDKLVNILEERLKPEPVGDYGVVYGYVLENIPRFLQDEREYFVEIQYVAHAQLNESEAELIKEKK